MQKCLLLGGKGIPTSAQKRKISIPKYQDLRHCKITVQKLLENERRTSSKVDQRAHGYVANMNVEQMNSLLGQLRQWCCVHRHGSGEERRCLQRWHHPQAHKSPRSNQSRPIRLTLKTRSEVTSHYRRRTVYLESCHL